MVCCKSCHGFRKRCRSIDGDGRIFEECAAIGNFARLRPKILFEKLMQTFCCVTSKVDCLDVLLALIKFEIGVVVGYPLDGHALVLVNPARLFEKPFDLRKTVESSGWA